MGRRIVEETHRATHLGESRLTELIRKYYLLCGVYKTARDSVGWCVACAQVNASPSPLVREAGTRRRGDHPGEHWEVDFTEMTPASGGYCYMLVFIDTFSGWAEVFPTKGETAQVVVKHLVNDIVPRFGLPVQLGSANGPAFIAKLTQLLASTLQITWNLHCVYRPQSSGQVERLNRTLKEIITRMKLETGGDWVGLLPQTLLRVRCTPGKEGLTPFEVLYGLKPPVVPRVGLEHLTNLKQQTLLKSLQALQTARTQAHAALADARPNPSPEVPGKPLFAPGDLVYVKKISSPQLTPRWDGPFQVIISTPTVALVAGKTAWVHHSWLKRAPAQDDQGTWRIIPSTDPLKVKITRSNGQF